jgi:hypothetical protein
MIEENLEILLDSELGELEMLFTEDNIVYYAFCFYIETLN